MPSHHFGSGNKIQRLFCSVSVVSLKQPSIQIIFESLSEGYCPKTWIDKDFICTVLSYVSHMCSLNVVLLRLPFLHGQPEHCPVHTARNILWQLETENLWTSYNNQQQNYVLSSASPYILAPPHVSQQDKENPSKPYLQSWKELNSNQKKLKFTNRKQVTATNWLNTA